MKRLNLCIAYPNKSVYSETFIHNHIKHLEPSEKIYGGWFPIYDSKDKCILRFPLDKLIIRGILKRVSSKSFHKIYTQYFSKFLYKNNINVVLAEYGITGYSVLSACESLNIPLIVHFHGFDAFEIKTIQDYKNKYKKLFNYSSSIIAVSKPMVEQLLSLGAKKEKIFYNPCGIDMDLFKKVSPQNSSPNFLAVGRFTPKKGQKYTIEAFNTAHKKHPDAKLYFVGDGEDLDECKKLVNKLYLDKSIIFLGRQTQNHIIELISKSRGFLQHSIISSSGDMEGTPLVILEASASGLPVVSTFHSGIPEAVLHTKTGYLVEEQDVNRMAEYIIKLIECPELCKKLGDAGHEHILTNYNINNRIYKLLQLLQSFIK
ncbi:MAG: glycosyltransferase family 4 protein [Bacteroidetes bacterium]|nr:glycosyltransferase family 4 protein [Bacteroidota bacterium]